MKEVKEVKAVQAVQAVQAAKSAEAGGVTAILAGGSWLGWVFALLLLCGTGWVLYRYGAELDGYDTGVLLGTAALLLWLGRVYPPVRLLLPVVAACTLLAMAQYQGSLEQAQQRLLLRYLLSSQSAILWMSLLFVLSTVFYWLGLAMHRRQSGAMYAIASWMCWAGIVFALVGTLVRWHESYLTGPDVGHIPVSNLYEVFVLFCWMTAAFYMYFEDRYRQYSLGAFVMLTVTAAVGFLLWYSVTRQAHEIQALVPALQSWWMKLHVPANFVGYGMFALAAMVAFAALLKSYATESSWWKLLPLWLTGLVLCIEPVAFRSNPIAGMSSYWMVYAGVVLLLVAVLIALRARIAPRLPDAALLGEVMYRAIAIGFAFFTVATILGALWAAEAWGGYWSWDPKEVWALIVWLNYAAWLHMRLLKGWRGRVLAWWALVGLAVTTFAFLGVNMFLSGLHSYGEL